MKKHIAIRLHTNTDGYVAQYETELEAKNQAIKWAEAYSAQTQVFVGVLTAEFTRAVKENKL